MGRTDSPVVEAGVRFLIESMRADGSWPIDTNLATWVTTLSINALAEAGALPPEDVAAMREWLLGQQSRARASVHARGAGRVGVDAVERRRAGRRRHVGRAARAAPARRSGAATPWRRQRPASAGCWASRIVTAACRRSVADGERFPSIEAPRRSRRMRCRRGACGCRNVDSALQRAVRAAAAASDRLSAGVPA